MKTRSVILTVFITIIICLAIMTGTALLLVPAVIGGGQQNVADDISGVDYGKTPQNIALLFTAENGSGALIFLDFENTKTHTYIFEQNAVENAIKLPYQISYTLAMPNDFLYKLCDRLGGIDLELNGQKNRYFSASLAEFCENSTETDKLFKVSSGFFEKIAKIGLSSEDFMFIIEECETTLGYSVCYGFIDHISKMAENCVFH